MGKVKIDLPEHFLYKTELTVRVSDLNYGGHLGNDAVLRLVHEARIRFLKSEDHTEFDVYGAGLIQSDAVIVYKSEAFHGDKIEVSVALSDFTNAACDFYYLLTHQPSGKEVARAKTRIVFYDYRHRKKLPVPAAFLEKFQNS
ncbi:MAG: thioesterase family protein [Bacteroidales bacterium]|nr:thioesterase family protein [Bacteroidales bacterium]